MGGFIDLTEQRFGRLIVLERTENKVTKGGYQKTRWICQCDCGNKIIANTADLRNGSTQSCGCYMREKASLNGSKRKTHGLTHTRLYNIWRGIKKRCNNPSDNAYKDYGGRGIKICTEWNDSFEVFRDWALLHGYQDNLTIEREDVNGNYEPNNCKWVTMLEQARNRRKSIRLYDIDGKKKHMREVIDTKKISFSAVEARIRNGWDIEQAITTSKIRNEDRGKKVEQISIETGEIIKKFDSIAEASRQTGLSKQSIGLRCRKGGSEFSGYIWRFEKKMEIKIKYLVDGLDEIKLNPKGDMTDLRCAEDIEIKKGEYKLIPLGVAMELPEGYFAEVFPRSSTFSKYKIIMANSVGVIDHSYCGNTDMWYFPAYAVEDTKIEKNTRICQFLLVKQNVEDIEIKVVDDLNNEDRGGFGSTGVN